MTTGKAFVLRKAGDVATEERPLSTLDNAPDDFVLVRPLRTGICGSDVHYYHHGAIGEFVVREPMILGHESSGEIVAVGKSLPPSRSHLKVGDRVALEPGATCRVCDACKRGQYELCPDVKFAATPPYDGTLQSTYALPSDLVYKLPDSMSLEDGALIEPLAVAVQAVAKVGNLRPDQNVAIFGAGPVGLLCLAVAKAFGARRIAVTDINEDRLAFARRYGATDTVKPAKPPARDADIETKMAYAQQTAEGPAPTGFAAPRRGRDGFDLVLDCTGAEPCIQAGIFATKEGARGPRLR